MKRIFPLTTGKIIVMALIAGTPSFILGHMINANFAGMAAGLGGFIIVLLKVWPKMEAALAPYTEWTAALRFAVVLRVVQSLAGISSFLTLRLAHEGLFEWTLTPDFLGGLLVAEILSGRGWIVPFLRYPEFIFAFMATFLQGIVLLLVMFLTMLPVAFLLRLWRKFRLLAA